MFIAAVNTWYMFGVQVLTTPAAGQREVKVAEQADRGR